MPVIGHAFVGLATADIFEPPTARGSRASITSALWLPIVVCLAYLPDIVTQAGPIVGWSRASLAGHSVPLGIALGGVIGMIWARLTDASPLRLTMIAAG